MSSPIGYLVAILLISVFSLTVSIIGYLCLKNAGKTNESNAKFLIFNMVVSCIAILGSAFALYNGKGGNSNSPYPTVNFSSP